jgi:hypothetical protein
MREKCTLRTIANRDEIAMRDEENWRRCCFFNQAAEALLRMMCSRLKEGPKGQEDGCQTIETGTTGAHRRAARTDRVNRLNRLIPE